MTVHVVEKEEVVTKELKSCRAFVESETNEGLYYKVEFIGYDHWECTCPDYKFRHNSECKHIIETSQYLKNESN